MIRARANAGFSLIELSIAMVLVGLFAASSLATYKVYAVKKAAGATVGRAEVVRVALEKFFVKEGRLPCPARPDVTEASTDHGVEKFGSAGPPATCSTSHAAILHVGTTKVAIGAIPFKALNITAKDTYDAWGNKFVYAVTERLTSQVSYDHETVVGQGAITIISPAEELYGSNQIIGGMTAKDKFKLLVMSMGRNGKGAYPANGTTRKPCDTSAMEGENCDGDDSRFFYPHDTIWNGPGENDDRPVSFVSLVPGDNYYDDVMPIYNIDVASDFWKVPSASYVTASGSGNVGIGTNRPAARLDVKGGNILVEEDLRAGLHCKNTDADGNFTVYNPYSSLPVTYDCMDVQAVFSNTGGIDCNLNGMAGVAYNNAVCPVNVEKAGGGEILKAGAGTWGGKCPDGQLVTGITAAGDIICTAVP